MRLLVLIFCCFSFVSGFAQVLKGQLTDESGEPIPFAKIRIRQTSYGTVSNAMGNYQLELKNGTFIIDFTSPDYVTRTDTIVIDQSVTQYSVTLSPTAAELEETVITTRSKRDLGKEIMKQVIDKRSFFADQLSKYSCNTYCFASLEKEITDSIRKDSVISKQKINITEWNGTSYFRAATRYKDIITGFTDLSENARPPTANTSFGASLDASLEPYSFQSDNPYIFVNKYQDADINLFENLVRAPGLSQRPLTSPLAYNAFLYYQFYVLGSFFEKDGQKVYEISVVPRFKEEALFEGTLFIRDQSWELVSYDLAINKGALTFFKDMRIVCDYEKQGERLLPVRREFVYLIKEGRKHINGIIRLQHTDYRFEYDDSQPKFWLETTVYTPEAYDRDTSYWNTVRPFQLKDEELRFIYKQDSIMHYYESEKYLKEQDSIYNTLKVWDFLFNGIGFRNTFKKQEFYIDGLISQVVPFGVGGYRHRLSIQYDKGFKNNHKLTIKPLVDYGFHNKDLKGQLGVGYLYNPRRFAQFFVEGGDVYDFLNNYQSLQGTFSPANRVRNRKFELYHRMELFNGLYFKSGIFYSNRSSIGDIDYPSWVDAFGFFSKPQPFEGYKIFMTDVEFSYHFRQKYIMRGNQKVIVGSQWPILSLQHKKGIPKLFGGQSDFDFLELRLTDEINFNSFGKSEIKFVGGSFVRKKDLRIVEHKYFRTSDKFFFSNPINSLQLLDTALNTGNSYLQFNFIHHFNGFFLNKVWLLNKLKLQETIGGGFLSIPDAHYAHVEFYAGIERQFRIKKQLFKIGVYAVTADSNFSKADVSFKVGVNFYNSFYKKWDY